MQKCANLINVLFTIEHSQHIKCGKWENISFEETNRLILSIRWQQHVSKMLGGVPQMSIAHINIKL